MRIGFDAKRLFHNHTGLGNYSRTLVRNLQKNYPDNQYFLFTPSFEKSPENSYFLSNPDFTIITPKSSNFFWRQWSIVDQIDDLDLDIYHGLSHELPFKKLKSTTKLIVTIHDLIWEKYPHYYRWIDSFFYSLKYRKSARVADHIVTVSDSTALDIQQLWNISEKKISTIYQSCHPAFKTHPITTTIKKHFLYVGSIEERKRLKDIIVALSQINEEDRRPLVVIGEGKKYKIEVKRMIQQLDLTDWVSFLGKIDNQNLIDFYDEAIALIYPSEYEGFGIPVIEAAYRKIPVITSTVSSLPEAGGPHAIYLPPGNIEELRMAMLEVIRDPSNFNERVELTYEYVHSRFNQKELSDQLMQLYNHLLEE